jgi:hypothetical protein
MNIGSSHIRTDVVEETTMNSGIDFTAATALGISAIPTMNNCNVDFE